MKTISFYKMSGSGNDFIIVDNRKKIVDENDLSVFIQKICQRKMSVGADGFILVENSDKADFKWRFYNSDGSRAEMCGNGARCTARFAFINKISGYNMAFQTDVGIVHAQIQKDQNDQVKIQMTEPKNLKIDDSIKLKKGVIPVSSINTGVPHAVIFTEDIESADVVNLGREIRFHNKYAPAGTNVNFVSLKNDGSIAIRTYERGVEDETLACGTGSVASALIIAKKAKKESPIKVLTKSGMYLTIHFKNKEDSFSDVYLEGDARVIYKGELCEDAWK